MKRSNHQNWYAYRKAYHLSLRVFLLPKHFPPVERYSLTNQIRRSSRSVCAKLAESAAKRRYPSHFISKVTDAAGENF